VRQESTQRSFCLNAAAPLPRGARERGPLCAGPGSGAGRQHIPVLTAGGRIPAATASRPDPLPGPVLGAPDGRKGTCVDPGSSTKRNRRSETVCRSAVGRAEHRRGERIRPDRGPGRDAGPAQSGQDVLSARPARPEKHRGAGSLVQAVGPITLKTVFERHCPIRPRPGRAHSGRALLWELSCRHKKVPRSAQRSETRRGQMNRLAKGRARPQKPTA
jgi:hypothetical protein